MAYSNLTGGILTLQREGAVNIFEAASGVTVYDGSPVCIASGKASVSPEAGSLFAGIARDTFSEKGGVYSSGVFRLAGSSLTAADIGKTAYWDASSSGSPGKIAVSAPETAGAIVLAVGIVTDVPSASEAEVYITGYAMKERGEAVQAGGG